MKNNNIRIERLKGTYKLLAESGENSDTVKINLKYVKGIIDELREKNETVYVSGQGIDFNIEELYEIKKIYSRVLRLQKGV